MKNIRKRLGDVLIDSGLLTKEQLNKALELQAAGSGASRQRKKRLGRILFELNYVTEDQLANALSLQLGIPRVDPAGVTIPEEVIQLVNRETTEAEILIPYKRDGKRLHVAMSDPLDFMAMDDIRFRTGLEVLPAVATESAILNAIERYYRVEEVVENILRGSSDAAEVEFLKETEEEIEAPQTLKQLGQTAPVVKLVTTVILDAIRRRATDIHIEPRESYVQVRYRVDGNLQDTLKLPKRVQASVVSRIKVLGKMDIANRMSPQDGSTKMRYGKSEIDLRISTLPAMFGEKVVIRILDRSRGLIPLPQLGVPELLIKKLQEAGGRAQGMIIVTGPTGSGKTTTLYSFLQWLQDSAVNIITVEDPVEYSIPGITQVSVREQSGLGFPAFMRSALRQDPDIILVGEVRDLETAEIAIRAALTGHFVLTTLHTNDTVATIVRLVDLGVQPFLVSSAVSGIVAQRLVRRTCRDCKQEVPFPEGDLPAYFPRPAHCYQGKGCPNCDFTGYRGQVGVYEYLDVDSHLKRLIANNSSEEVLRSEAVKSGLVSLFQDAWEKVAQGLTTVYEVMAKVPFYAPAQPPEPVAPLPKEAQNAQRETKASILVVDNDPAEEPLLRGVLESQGYRIIGSDWNDTFEMMCRESPDAVILNLDLPHADWAGLRSKLQSSLSTITVPILFLKSDADWTQEVEILREGAVGMIRRPLDSAEILARVDDALKLAI